MPAILLAVISFVSRSGVAEDVTVPAEIQAELLAKLALYDRNFAARAGDTVRVAIVVRSADARSQLSAKTMLSALSRVDKIGGLPHRDTIVAYESIPALVKACRSERYAVLYATAGLDEEIERLAAGLKGVDVLSVAAVPEFVPRGVVLGFDVVSSKPRILLNLAQAKQQNVSFKGDVLSLMKVFK
jgi:hypothetical protein